MPSIRDIAKALGTTKVRLSGGAEVEVRALTEDEVSRIYEVLPRPVPPLGKDPARGSEAPWLPNETDPGYQQRLTKWVERSRRMEAAIAMGLTTTATGKTWELAKATASSAADWFAEVETEMLASPITRQDLRNIAHAAAKLAGGLDDAEGN